MQVSLYSSAICRLVVCKTPGSRWSTQSHIMLTCSKLYRENLGELRVVNRLEFLRPQYPTAGRKRL